MELVVMYAFENVCQQKVSYDTVVSWFDSHKEAKTGLCIDSLDFEWICNEIEYMTGLVLDDDYRFWLAEEIRNNKCTISDLIGVMETQSMLIKSRKIAQRNPAGHPISLKQEKMSLLQTGKDGLRCALTEQKCDKIPQGKTAYIKDVCVRSNCKIAQNFYKLARKTR